MKKSNQSAEQNMSKANLFNALGITTRIAKITLIITCTTCKNGMEKWYGLENKQLYYRVLLAK
jgi:hypothetical protein